MTEARAERGRPRSERARHAVLGSAAELLLAEGLAGVTMDAVAQRAGVSKATIYRWWPTKELLAVDALFDEWDAAVPGLDDTGSLRGDLLALIRPWVRLVTTRPYPRVVAGLLAKAHTDPAFAEVFRTHLVQPRRRRAQDAFERAIGRGDIAPPASMELAIDLLYGPIYHRLLQGHAPVDDPFVRDHVDAVVAALGGAPPGRA
jgi:AcrR family transcriptional regulator